MDLSSVALDKLCLTRHAGRCSTLQNVDRPCCLLQAGTPNVDHAFVALRFLSALLQLAQEHTLQE